MKKVKLILLLLLGICTLSMAQTKKKVQATVTINTPTLQCEACKTLVENYLTREDGVTKSVADFRKKQVKVTYWTDRTTVENIRIAIANAGFDADNETANPDSYKMIPKCCKKTEDQGGEPMDKKK